MSPESSVSASADARMTLKILLPTHTLLTEPVTRVVAEGEEGSFCLLPRHIDYLAAIVPGILEYSTVDGRTAYVGVSDGILVKTGSLVRVSVRHGVRGDDLENLRTVVREQFLQLQDRERAALTAMAKLEADFVRRFLKLGESAHAGIG